MITDQQIEEQDQEIRQIFETTWDPDPPENDARIDRIVERAMFENVCKDTTTFLFKSVGAAVGGLVGAVFGTTKQGESTDTP